MEWSWLIGDRPDCSRSELNTRQWIGVLWTLAPWLILAFSYKTSKGMGSSVTWRPPSATYGVFWPVLIVLLSTAWVLISRKSDLPQFGTLAVLFLLLIGLCIGWLFAYAEKKQNGIAVFLGLLSVIGMALPIALKCDIYAGALLMPLLVWVVFQLGVNCQEVEILSGLVPSHRAFS